MNYKLNYKQYITFMLLGGITLNVIVAIETYKYIFPIGNIIAAILCSGYLYLFLTDYKILKQLFGKKK